MRDYIGECPELCCEKHPLTELMRRRAGTELRDGLSRTVIELYCPHCGGEAKARLLV